MIEGLTKIQAIKLIEIDGQIAKAQAYVAYWAAMANSGAYKNRIMRHGGSDGDELTEQEKLQDCMETILVHIRRIEELHQYKAKIIEGTW